MQRAIVLVDLDDTLIMRYLHSDMRADDEIRYPAVNVSDMLRPGAIEFLRRIAARAHIALCTNKPYPYSDSVHQYLSARVPELAAVDEHELNRMRSSEREWVSKHLNNIFCDAHDVRRCILIDDDMEYVYANVGRAIPALDYSQLAHDWNTGLLHRILPIVERALDAHEAGAAATAEPTADSHAPINPRSPHSDSTARADKRARSGEAARSRETLLCATYIETCSYCRDDHNIQLRAQEAFSAPVRCARTGALLHARFNSEHPRIDMNDVGLDDPIARVLIERAYGETFVRHWTCFKDAWAALHAQINAIKAKRDALPDYDGRFNFGLSSSELKIMYQHTVSYTLDGTTYLASDMPACLKKFRAGFA